MSRTDFRHPPRSSTLAGTIAGLVVGACTLTVGLGVERTAHADGATIAFEVSGPHSNPDKQQRCLRVLQKSGVLVNPGAPIRASLILYPGTNRLVITSARRGEVFNQPRPGNWGMDELCRDVVQNVNQAIAREGDPRPVAVAPAPAYAPQNNYQPPPPPPPAYVPSGGPPTVAFDVTGPHASPDKQQRCLRVAQRKGFVVNPSAPVRVLLILQPGSNRLQITSARRGDVLNQLRPGWGMEQLCEDALASAAQVLQHEGEPPVGVAPPTSAYSNSRPAPAPAQQRPRPALALGPIPPGPELPGPAKAAADAAVAAWQGARFEQALVAFREAARLHNEPQFLFDQAVCEQRLGRYPEALAHTQQFLDSAPQSPYRPYAEQLFGELQQQSGGD